MAFRKLWTQVAHGKKPMIAHMITRRFSILFPLLAMTLAACGAGQPTPTPLPTPTQIPTFAFEPPTAPPQVATIGAASATAAATVVAGADPAKIEAGKGRYVALECGSCHGDAGQGTDKGPRIAGTKLSEDEFINVLRSGGKLGNAHLFSTNRLSTTGGQNIYAFMLSLGSK
jgi:mono/diheme cytochrome c family protein